MIPLSKISRSGPRNRRSLVNKRVRAGRTADPSASPDFLLDLVALANFMRLSLLKGAHVALSSAAWQEIRVRSG
jgi:hypothetical protein